MAGKRYKATATVTMELTQTVFAHDGHEADAIMRELVRARVNQLDVTGRTLLDTKVSVSEESTGDAHHSGGTP